jgi:uncharacterized membrane protein YgdD (TMEM256/DUF423 family)
MNWLLLAAINGFVSVAAGAFGAHALKSRLPPEMLTVFETGARYQMFHALALGLIGLVALARPATPHLDAAGWSMLVGILLFSGSLYALALSGIRPLGAITPFGGVAFLAGWTLIALAARKL